MTTASKRQRMPNRQVGTAACVASPCRSTVLIAIHEVMSILPDLWRKQITRILSFQSCSRILVPRSEVPDDQRIHNLTLESKKILLTVGKISPLYTYSIPSAAVTANFPIIAKIIRMLVMVGSLLSVAVPDRDAAAPKIMRKMSGFLRPNFLSRNMDKR